MRAGRTREPGPGGALVETNGGRLGRQRDHRMGGLPGPAEEGGRKLVVVSGNDIEVGREACMYRSSHRSDYGRGQEACANAKTSMNPFTCGTRCQSLVACGGRKIAGHRQTFKRSPSATGRELSGRSAIILAGCGRTAAERLDDCWRGSGSDTQRSSCCSTKDHQQPGPAWSRQ